MRKFLAIAAVVLAGAGCGSSGTDPAAEAEIQARATAKVEREIKACEAEWTDVKMAIVAYLLTNDEEWPADVRQLDLDTPPTYWTLEGEDIVPTEANDDLCVAQGAMD